MEIHGTKFDDLFTAKSEQLFGDCGGLGARTLNLVEVHACPGRRRKRALEEFCGAVENHKHVIEIVGTPPARRPRTSSFCDWRTCAAMRLASLMSSTTDMIPTMEPSSANKGAADALTGIEVESARKRTVS